MERENPLFEETQQFRQVWVWLILVGVFLLLSYEVYQQIILDNVFGQAPTPDLVLFLIWLFIGIGLPAGFYNARLVTKVYPGRISIRFHPIHRSEHEYPLGQIERVEAVTYRPILHYGGWGIRVGWGGKAYNVSGRHGVKLHFSSGRPLLIGSQRPEELTEAIERAMVHEDN